MCLVSLQDMGDHAYSQLYIFCKIEEPRKNRNHLDDNIFENSNNTKKSDRISRKLAAT